MSDAPLRAENSPFSGEQAELLSRVIPTLTDEQLIWLGGYLAGVRSRLGQRPAEIATSVASAPSAGAIASAASSGAGVTVLFGSQTGNAMRLAGEISRRLEQAGLSVTLSCMSEYRTSALKKTRCLLVVASTHGEGEPPDKAPALPRVSPRQARPAPGRAALFGAGAGRPLVQAVLPDRQGF